MQNEHIINLLGLQGINEKFYVRAVKHVKNKTNIIFLETKQLETCCPKCGNLTKKKKETAYRNMQHGYICGNKCIIKLAYIRYSCKHCSSTFFEDITKVVEKYSRHSNVSILNVMDTLGYTRTSVKEISGMSGMDHRLINKLFAIKVALNNLDNITELPENIGIDEFKGNMKHIKNGKKYKFKFQIQITDLDTSKVIALLPVKDNECIEGFLKTIKNKDNVKTVAIDMSMQFKRTFLSAFRKAKIIVDYFHVTKLVTAAVDNIRLDLWRKYKDDKTKEGKEIRKYLKSLKTKLLTDINGNIRNKYRDKIKNKLDKVFEYTEELKIAYGHLQEFYDIKRLEKGEDKVKAFKSWFNKLKENKSIIFKSIKTTIYHWYKYILNTYETTYSNGKTEGNNNTIKVLKRVSFGFGNFENAKNRILVYC